MSARFWFPLLMLVAGVGCTKTTTVDRDGGADPAGGSGGTRASGGSGGGDRGGSGGKGGSGGSASKDDAGAATTGADGSVLDVDGGVPCGAEVCKPGACCADPFVSLCGAPIGERACLIPSPEGTMSDARCPSIDVMGLFTIPSCCTEDGQCGIDATNFGSGCVELSVAAEMAGQMGGGFIEWPKPRACE